MTEKGHDIIVDRRSSLRTLPSGARSTRKRGSSALDRETLDDYEESPKILRANDSAHLSNGVHDTASQNLPPICKPSTVSWSGDLPSQVCLCQPDPKVPRPRNAFILYRQHHQAAVVAQNPGLANPEISKVIGDHWRTSPPEIKNHWKVLAEEEKLRHQKQYPDYRYQPRRNARNNSVTSPNSATNLSSSTQRCVKCGGRSISTPSMTSAPTSASSGSYTPGLPVPTITPSSGGRFIQNVGTPHSILPPQQYRQHPPNSDTSPPLPSRHYYTPDYPVSPDSKRRRVDSTSYTPMRTAAGPQTPLAFPISRRRESLPRPDFMPMQNSGTFIMGPPPRPPYYTHHGQQGSLTLAPLQSAQSETAAKSVKATVMSIPALNKIKVLAKISPPMTGPEPTSPEYSSRGVVIAIEGADQTAVQHITEYLSTHLSSSGGRPLRTFQAPPGSPPLATSMMTKDHGEPTLLTYLQTIASYHTLSEEISSYIVTHSTSPSSAPVSPKSTSPPPERKQIPIALVPNYQLTHTDAFAASVEIKDSYAPVDHWQWMATLWRGVIGPDITIVIKKAVANGAGMEEKESVGLGIDGMGGKSGVEVRLQDARAIVVTVDSGEKGVGEGELRRVGFEVGEWVLGREEGRPS